VNEQGQEQSEPGGRRASDRMCLATTRAGTRCRAPVLVGESYCLSHHPAYEQKRRQMRSLGGQATTSRLRLLTGAIDYGTPEATRRFGEALTRAVIRNEVPPARATAAWAIAEGVERLRAGVELIARMDALEAQLDELLREEAGIPHES